MALDREQNPRTVHLAGPLVELDDFDHEASATIKPGHVIEMHDSSGVTKWRPHDTSTEIVTLAVALDRPELNKGLSDNYSSGDVVKAGFLAPGSVFYGLIPSGQNISNGEFLQSNGDGTLVTASATTQDAALAKFQSLDNPGSVSSETRLRVQVIQ